MKTTAFTKTYNRRVVLYLPELELPKGKITAIIGPNGSGKSTFAKILAGIERSDEKKPILSGVKVGYLPQKSFPFRMSTEKNILQNGNDPARARELMHALGIEALAGQSAKKLSGGETARMALCRILMSRYDLLILDEPTTAMDMESTLAAEKLIRPGAGPAAGRADRAGRRAEGAAYPQVGGNPPLPGLLRIVKQTRAEADCAG